VVLGTLLALVPNRRAAIVLVSVPQKAWDGSVVGATAEAHGVAAVTTRGASDD